MKVSDQMINKMKTTETLRLTSYKDQGGVWTIGWGHTHGVHEGQTITEAQAESLFKGDLLTFERAVAALYPRATQKQFDALVSLAYNSGVGAVSGNLYSLIKRGSDEKTIKKWWKTHYITAQGIRSNGLIKRRAWEAEWYFSS